MQKELFENTKVAFTLKSNAELNKAYFLFKILSNNSIVKLGSSITNLFLQLKLPIKNLIKATVFDQFCGGETEQESLIVAKKLHEKCNVLSILDYSVEGKTGEENFNNTFIKLEGVIDIAIHEDSIPFTVFKPTSIGEFSIYHKKSSNKELTIEEIKKWTNIKKRFTSLCQKASNHKLPLLIDAEESWMQNSADELIESLMQTFNTEKTIVFNTLQMYRKDRLPYLKKLKQKAEKNNFKVGIKLVRGAYMEKENERATEKNYESPICINKVETDKNFNNALEYILQNLTFFEVFIGTHNEKSCYKAIELMEHLKIEKDDNRIWFSQLYGMSDHISFNLANEGYNVAKYLPFGPVKDVMPYLLRRAKENTSVKGQTTRELGLLKKEHNRRKL